MTKSRPIGYIDDWRLTDHAIRRAVLRRLDAQNIRDALNSPLVELPAEHGRIQRRTAVCSVVVDLAAKVIVTVF